MRLLAEKEGRQLQALVDEALADLEGRDLERQHRLDGAHTSVEVANLLAKVRLSERAPIAAPVPRFLAALREEAKDFGLSESYQAMLGSL